MLLDKGERLYIKRKEEECVTTKKKKECSKIQNTVKGTVV